LFRSCLVPAQSVARYTDLTTTVYNDKRHWCDTMYAKQLIGC